MRAPIILVSQDRLDLLPGQVAGRSHTVGKVYRPHLCVRGKTLNALPFTITPASSAFTMIITLRWAPSQFRSEPAAPAAHERDYPRPKGESWPDLYNWGDSGLINADVHDANAGYHH